MLAMTKVDRLCVTFSSSSPCEVAAQARMEDKFYRILLKAINERFFKDEICLAAVAQIGRI
jgi:hypothetical protein